MNQHILWSEHIWHLYMWIRAVQTWADTFTLRTVHLTHHLGVVDLFALPCFSTSLPSCWHMHSTTFRVCCSGMQPERCWSSRITFACKVCLNNYMGHELRWHAAPPKPATSTYQTQISKLVNITNGHLYIIIPIRHFLSQQPIVGYQCLKMKCMKLSLPLRTKIR